VRSSPSAKVKRAWTTICFGCHRLLHYADSHCQCVDDEDARMQKVIEEHDVVEKLIDSALPKEEDDALHLGFRIWEGCVPVRANVRCLPNWRTS